MKYLEREDIKKIAIEIAKKVKGISNDNAEFNEIMQRIIDLSLDEEFTFGELENLIKLAENTKSNVNKDSVLGIYVDRVLPACRKIKTQNDKETYKTIAEQSIIKIREFTKSDVNLLETTLSSRLLDDLIPAKELNFKANFVEALGIVRDIINEKEVPGDAEFQK